MLRFQTLIKLIRAHRKIGVFLSLVLLLAIAVSIIRLLMFLILVGITDFFFFRVVSWEIDLSARCGI